MTGWTSRPLWIAGTPVRLALVWLIKGYRASFGLAMGGRCRFYPSCSEYAEAAVANLGVVGGVSLSVWRVLRCSPLSKGGVDHPPAGRGLGGGAGMPSRESRAAPLYDADIQAEGSPQAVKEGSS